MTKPYRTVVVYVSPLNGDVCARYRGETHRIAGPVGDEIRAQLGSARLGMLHFYPDSLAYDRVFRTRLVAVGTHEGALLVAAREDAPELASAPMCSAFAGWVGLTPGAARYVTLEKAAA